MKGRNTTVIAIRVPDDLALRITELAKRRGVSVSLWCRVTLRQRAFRKGNKASE